MMVTRIKQQEVKVVGKKKWRSQHSDGQPPWQLGSRSAPAPDLAGATATRAYARINKIQDLSITAPTLSHLRFSQGHKNTCS